ncbi:enoyl-CoA hydratase/isomerase family protein [Pelomonas sp. KK5]|uniref:enoyl-CoA hydratase/isomerase family protein n=1 Tax=Pelomonas sp. KK5 TaxID=1855730 RepID=UPI00097C2A2C|nr:enoyl-CoA hydratase-related protein [Pelomonas sp. KK5]
METLFSGTRCTLTRHGEAVALLALHNPPEGFFDPQSEREVLQALDVTDTLDGLRALILHGRDPGMFVRHYDVKELERIGRALLARDLRFSPDSPPPPGGFHKILERLEAAPYLSIAAINGWCMGGGLELALGCHLRYAQPGDYRIGLLEVQLGLIPGAGGTQRLSRAVGPARALEMLLLGTCVTPEEAARLDLVHALVPDALAHALDVAATLARRPPEVLQHLVHLHRDAQDLTPHEGMARERGAFSQVLRLPQTLQTMADYNAGRITVPEVPACRTAQTPAGR